MAPAERPGHAKARTLRGLAHAQIVSERLKVGFKGSALMQERQGSSGERIEALATIPKAIALQTVGLS